MKKLLPGLLLLLGACSHTKEENYTMIHKVVGELATLNDSLTYLDSAITTALPGSKLRMEDGEQAKVYADLYVDSLVKSNDLTNTHLMKRFNVLNQRYTGYKEIYGIIYQELPKDSTATNARIKQSFAEATAGR
jgi:hypothetical protein